MYPGAAWGPIVIPLLTFALFGRSLAGQQDACMLPNTVIVQGFLAHTCLMSSLEGGLAGQQIDACMLPIYLLCKASLTINC